MSKFRVRRRSYLSGLRNFWMLSNKALKKYTDPENGDYNFLNVVFRIKLTEMQIQEQLKIMLSKRRQMPLLLTLLSCLFIYIPKIFAYVKQAVAIEWYEWIIFSLYFLLLISSVLFFYCTIFPKKIPHRYLPSQFYEGILDEYQKEGLDKVEANKGGTKYILKLFGGYSYSIFKLCRKNRKVVYSFHDSVTFGNIFLCCEYSCSFCSF